MFSFCFPLKNAAELTIHCKVVKFCTMFSVINGAFLVFSVYYILSVVFCVLHICDCGLCGS